jgi:hypothetical protein
MGHQRSRHCSFCSHSASVNHFKVWSLVTIRTISLTDSTCFPRYALTCLIRQSQLSAVTDSTLIKTSHTCTPIITVRNGGITQTHSTVNKQTNNFYEYYNRHTA